MNPICSSCRRSERNELATVAVVGRLNGMPYRANLCTEHFNDMEMNLGLEVRSCRRIVAAKVVPASLEAAYRHLCATVVLDDAGIARLDAARNRWFAALFA
jgi:hypothetical protein